ncbi:MAG: DUF1571 domain-containing protein [Isosphaeraceae bacterium]
MFRTKDGVHLLLWRMAACLTMALSLMELGCSGMTGFRSVGTDRPGLLGFWERPETAPPDPAGDYYARYMRSARDRADAMAKRSTESIEPSQDDDGAEPAQQGGEVVASRSRAGSTGKASASTKPVRDDSIQVTLGPPEPLAALTEPAPPLRDAELASTRPRSPSKRDRRPIESDNDPGPSPRLARHTDDGSDDSRDLRKSGPAPAPQRRVQAKSRDPKADPKALLAKSEAKVQSLSTYQVKISRTERVGGRILPEEQIILSIRRDPKAVRLEWADGPNQGREVIYSSRIDDKSLFVHMPKSAIPLPTMKIPVNSPMVMKNSRHSITEAGFDTIIENLRKTEDGSSKADMSRLAYRGIEKPPGLDRPSHIFMRRAPSGETWTVFLDVNTMLPSMVVAKDAKGELDERYIYHEVRENPNDLASADAFEPDQRWGQSKGLLSRFARGTPNADSSNNRQSATR